MQKDALLRARRLTVPLLGTVILLGVCLTSLYSYVLFHTLAELFSIVISFGIFTIAWNSRRFFGNDYLLFLGIAYLFVGAVDLLHTLAYKGMGVFPDYDANLPTQLWIGGRYLQSASLVLAPLFIRRKLRTNLALAAYAAVAGLLLWSVFGRVFPDAYVEGSGLTPFKIASEYAISALLLVSLALLIRDRRSFDPEVLRLLGVSIVVTVASELAFTFYVGVYDFSNLAGHVFKIVAFYLVYRAVIQTGLTKPYNLLLRDLQQLLVREHAARAEAEAAVRLREEFLSIAAHELRTPVTSLRGYAQLLLRQLDGASSPEPEQIRRGLQTIDRQSEKLVRLVARLLDVSRLRAGKLVLERQVTDLAALVANLASAMQATTDHLLIVRASASVQALVDPLRLEQVMVNLLDNAIRHSPDGDPVEIEVMTPSAAVVQLSVRDRGPGISPEDRERIFELLYQARSGPRAGGMGLGLYIARQIVDLHGGQIAVESPPDGGSRFVVTLPTGPAESAGAPAEPERRGEHWRALGEAVELGGEPRELVGPGRAVSPVPPERANV